MANRLQEQIAVSDYAVALPFQATNVPDANTTANSVEPTSPDYVAQYNGCMIGLSGRHNAALVSGTITWKPTINGTAVSGLAIVTDSSNQQAVANAAADVISFKRGDRIGLGMTKSGTVSPTTSDFAAHLTVLYEDVGL